MLATQKPINVKSNPKLNNLQSNNLQQNNPQTNIVNNYNIIQPVSSDTIIVEHDKNLNEFSFKNNTNQIIGKFNIYQLFKFLNNDIDAYLTDINIGTSDKVIMKYVYDPTKDINKSYELISHIDSPFTGNIELVVKLYADIIKIEGDLLERMINLNRDVIEKIKSVNNKFTYNILLLILKSSNTLLDQPNVDSNKKDILLRYSIGAVYKLSNMTKEEIEIKKLQYNELDNDINKVIKIQQALENKLEEFKKSIDEQNINIKNLMDNINKSSSKKSSNTSSQKSSNTPPVKSIKKQSSTTSSETIIISDKSQETECDSVNTESINTEDYSIKSFKSIPSLSNLSNPYNFNSLSETSQATNKSKTKSDKTKSLINSYNYGSTLASSHNTTDTSFE
jgi:hypothetical protein